MGTEAQGNSRRREKDQLKKERLWKAYDSLLAHNSGKYIIGGIIESMW